MISDHRMLSVLRFSNRSLRSLPVGLALIALATGLLSCEKAPLLAPSGATITLYTNAQTLPVNGTAQITAAIQESGGYAVQNGTVVTFTTSLGTLTPAEVGTQDGKATVTLNAGTASGTAEINAFSGANTAKATVKIVIGAANVNSVVAAANPASVSALGGLSSITATVLDTNNNGLSGITVTFSTDNGTISPTSATTSSAGLATATLSTNQTSTVTITAGSKTATAKVTVVNAPTLSITGPTTTPTVGLTASFTVNAQPGTGASPIRSVLLDYGDGSGTTNLGSVSGSITVPHIYYSAGTYTVTGIATDASGQSTSVSVPVVVFPAVPFTITVTAPSTKWGYTVTLTATPGSGSPTILKYEWNFGDGTIATTTTGTAPHVYGVLNQTTPSNAQYVVSVTAYGADGRTGVGSAIVYVTAL
jgi:hypothetical protein